MDKRAILGFIVIMAIIILWQPINKAIFGPAEIPMEQQQDSIITADNPLPDTAIEKPQAVIVPQLSQQDTAAPTELNYEPEKEIIVETKNLKIALSSKGGTVKTVALKTHKRYDDADVSFIGEYTSPDWTKHNAMTLGYNDVFPPFNDQNFIVEGENIVLSDANPTGSVKFTHAAANGGLIVKTYTFSYDDYVFNLDLQVKNAKNLGMAQGITVGWFTPMEPSESNFDNDKGKLGGFFSMGGEFDYFDKIKDGQLRRIATGPVDWVASRTKYFAAAIIAETTPGQEAIVVGSEISRNSPTKDGYKWNQYGIGMTYINPADDVNLRFTIYTGPLDYDGLKAMGKNLSSLVDMGWKVFRPFAIAIYWIFTNLYKFVPNYGFVIIIFSIIMKLVFWPLSTKSAKSMHQMRQVQPKLQEVKEKFKNDPAKLQQETMKVYKEYGVNPFGSCLPMLVQLPIFWALFSVLSNSIELRGAEFILWLTDLSHPDPTGDVLYVGVLPIIMGVSMFLQMKMTTTDPKQKMMVYLMPAVFTFLFSRWASGLVLYWTVFNIMGIFEQWFVKRKMKEEGAVA